MRQDQLSELAIAVLSQSKSEAFKTDELEMLSTEFGQVNAFFSQFQRISLSNNFYLDIHQAIADHLLDDIDYFRYRVGNAVCPIGKCSQYHQSLFMSECGRVFSKSYGVLGCYADSGTEAINHICREVVRTNYIAGCIDTPSSILADYYTLASVMSNVASSTDSIPSICKALLLHSDAQIVFDAARAVTWLAPPEHELMLQLCALASAHDISDVRRACLAAIVNIINRFVDLGIYTGFGSVIDTLGGLLLSEEIDFESRSLASLGIAALGPLAAPAKPILISLIKDESKAVLFRCQLVLTLGEISRSTSTLYTALSDSMKSFPDELNRAVQMAVEDLRAKDQ